MCAVYSFHHNRSKDFLFDRPETQKSSFGDDIVCGTRIVTHERNLFNLSC
jgi:hypothetical protein